MQADPASEFAVAVPLPEVDAGPPSTDADVPDAPEDVAAREMPAEPAPVVDAEAEHIAQAALARRADDAARDAALQQELALQREQAQLDAAEARRLAELQQAQEQQAQQLAQQEAQQRAQQEAQQQAQQQQAQQQQAQQQAVRDQEALLRQREQEAGAARELAEQRAAQEAAAQETLAQAQLQARQRAEEAAQRLVQQATERQRAEELAQRSQAEERARQQAAERQRIDELAQRKLAEERAREQAAEQARMAAERLARGAAEEAARQAAQRSQAQVAGPAAGSAAGPATGSGPAATRVDGAGTGAGVGQGSGPGALAGPGAIAGLPGNRARELLRGVTIPNIDAAGLPRERAVGNRRVVADGGERDAPLRLYVDSVRQKLERNAVLGGARLSLRDVRIDPLVSVALRSDGSIDEVTIVRSSGRADVDDAVRRFVRLNARYAVFPPNVAANFDVIEIRRIWRFGDGLKLVEEMR